MFLFRIFSNFVVAGIPIKLRFPVFLRISTGRVNSSHFPYISTPRFCHTRHHHTSPSENKIPEDSL